MCRKSGHSQRPMKPEPPLCAPSPKGREEREDLHALLKYMDSFVVRSDSASGALLSIRQWIVARLRTRTPGEPVGWLVLGTWDDSGKSRAEIVTNGRLDTREAAEREASEWARIAPNVTYTVHPVGSPIGQPLTDGEPTP